tara:strand:+ start:121 stop:267 length:147 start_codon:yes stop_codon:yes gene_type:complete
MIYIDKKSLTRLKLKITLLKLILLCSIESLFEAFIFFESWLLNIYVLP